ncbi:16076_t:CDS:2 [Entrophospora sp. SA101]|nr:16076_t:CDS:2 [Entrophospora sp. SA101]
MQNESWSPRIRKPSSIPERLSQGQKKEATESINVPKLIDTVIAGSFIKDDYGKLPNEEISSEPIHEVHFFGIFKELNIVQ